MSFVATVKANLVGEIDLDSAFQLSTTPSITRGFASTLDSTVSLQTTLSKQVNAGADLNSTTTLTASGRLITFDADLTYVVPSETRTATIFSESREFTIDRETREYKFRS
jgi:hypothetical protein